MRAVYVRALVSWISFLAADYEVIFFVFISLIINKSCHNIVQTKKIARRLTGEKELSISTLLLCGTVVGVSIYPLTYDQYNIYI